MRQTMTSFSERYGSGGFAPRVRAHRLAGSAPLNLIELAQPPDRYTDPPISDFVLIEHVSGPCSLRIDYGAGRFTRRSVPQDLYLRPPGQSADIELDAPHVIRAYAIRADALPAFIDGVRPDALRDLGHLHAGAFRSDVVSALCKRLWTEAERNDEVTRLFTDGAMMAIISALLREGGTIQRSAKGGLAGWQLRRVTEYVEAHIDRDLSLIELSALVGLSPNHFCTAFRQSMGSPPHGWLRQRRVERAQRLMRVDKDLSLAEIAMSVGYSSQSAFGTAFRRVAGASPAHWRREQA